MGTRQRLDQPTEALARRILVRELEKAVPRSCARVLADRVVDAAYEEKTKKVIVVRTHKEKGVRKVVRYSTLGALGAIAGGVAGVGGGVANPALGACAVVAALVALKGVRQTIPRSHGTLLWVVYQAPDHKLSREDAEAQFAMCAPQGVKPTDFGAALGGLIAAGSLSEQSGTLEVTEWIIVRRSGER